MSKNHKYLKAKPVPTKKQKITIAALIAAIVVVLLLIIILLGFMGKSDPAPTEPTAPMETTVPADTEATEASEETTVPPETEPQMLPHMKELYEQNPDTVGWIRIEGTKVDYPVMYVPEDEERYIHADFEGKYDYAGLPFIDADCSMDPESQNLVIYGHNMSNGTGFRAIMNYQQEDYFKAHPIISLTTLYEEREYEVISCFFDRVYYVNETCFKFYQFIDPATEEEFNVGRDYFKTTSLHETEKVAEYGDQLITLVTCAYHVEDGRFVVVARLIEDEPAESETTAPKT